MLAGEESAGPDEADVEALTGDDLVNSSGVVLRGPGAVQAVVGDAAEDAINPWQS
jgi:hypothetical protein